MQRISARKKSELDEANIEELGRGLCAGLAAFDKPYWRLFLTGIDRGNGRPRGLFSRF
jgi:hypothetical protein